MAYLVLARKYRPRVFSEVVGQEHVTRTMANAFASGRVHHAFLLCGPRGVGKTTLARILGKAINCEQGSTAEPCGACGACTTIAAGNAVDYYEMDGASNRGIDSIRDLVEAVRYQPAVLRKKVYVIDEVHMLTTEAFNALLKTLEEPPPHVMFVLATTEPHKLPNTILSRCQRYDFKLVPASRLAQHLAQIFAAEALAIEPGAISLIVRESGGSVRDALSLCDQVISYVGAAAITERHAAEVLGVADRALTRRLVDALASGDASGALTAADQAAERGVDEVQLARAIVHTLRDLAVLQVGRDRAARAQLAQTLVDASEEERQELLAEAERLDRGRVQQMFERMLRLCDDLGRTLQPRLQLELALIDVATVEPMLPLGDLLARLGELERRLGGAPRGGGRGGEPGRGPEPRGPEAGRAPARPSGPPVRAEAAPPSPVRAEAAPPPVRGAGAPVPAHDASPRAAAPPTPEPSARGPAPAAAPRPPESTRSPPPVRGAGAPADLLAAWDGVLAALEERRKISLYGYEHARVLAWTVVGDGVTIEVGFPESAHPTGEFLGERDKLDEMRTFLREYLGRPVELRTRLLSPQESASGQARSLQEASRERQVEERRARESEARAHPATRLVLETFGATIKEIKTDV